MQKNIKKIRKNKERRSDNIGRTNIREQLQFAVRDNFQEHINKHSLQSQHIRADGRPKSYDTLHAQRDTAREFGRWEMQNHPEIRMVRDIPTSHFNEWLKEKAESGKWSAATRTAKTSEIRSIIKNMHRTFANVTSNSKDIKSYDVPPQKHEKIRVQAFEKEDFSKVHSIAEEKTSRTLERSLDISHAAGLRAAEISRLKADHIEIQKDKVIIHNFGAKNGRDYPIYVTDKKDMQNMTRIREEVGRGYIFPAKDGTHCLRPDTIERSLRRGLEQAGISGKYSHTGFHSIRKEWAQRQFDDHRKTHSKDESKAYVSEQLGHADTRGADMVLMARYVANIY